MAELPAGRYGYSGPDQRVQYLHLLLNTRSSLSGMMKGQLS